MVTLDHSPVSSNPGVLGAAVVFRGTRVPVQTLVDYLADGYSLDEFLEFFPGERTCPANETSGTTMNASRKPAGAIHAHRNQVGAVIVFCARERVREER